MSKPMNPLKEAIQGLNIKKPFDLRAQMKPALKAPGQSEQVQTEVTQVEQAQKEPTQTRPAEIKPAQNEPAQTTPAENEQAQTVLASAGFFMLAHSVFQNPVLRDLSGDAFRVFIWMSSQAWRYRESNGQFRASVDYVVKRCGCSRSTVTRALADLKEARLIECVEQNFKKGNLWQVSRIADGRNEQVETELAQDEKEAGSKRDGSMPKMSREQAQNEHHLRNSLTNNKNSEEAAAFQNELKVIWARFSEAYPSEATREIELQNHLRGLPFGPRQAFARDLAVLKWWEGLPK